MFKEIQKWAKENNAVAIEKNHYYSHYLLIKANGKYYVLEQKSTNGFKHGHGRYEGVKDALFFGETDKYGAGCKFYISSISDVLEKLRKGAE